MYWDKSDVKVAFELFLMLLKKGKIEKREREMYQLYTKEQVQEILNKLIAQKANMKILETEDALYIVPNMDN
ncbi:hypothetical protein G5716_29940 [Bacillus pacificus]|nr:hypothetical protein [Bacillus pacificus]